MWFVYERVHIYCQAKNNVLLKNDVLSEAFRPQRLFMRLKLVTKEGHFCVAKSFQS